MHVAKSIFEEEMFTRQKQPGTEFGCGFKNSYEEWEQYHSSEVVSRT
jgi:hypothetical protein